MLSWYDAALFYAQGAIDTNPKIIGGTMAMQDATVFAELYSGRRNALDIGGFTGGCPSMPRAWEEYKDIRRRVRWVPDNNEHPVIGTTVSGPIGGFVSVRWDDSRAIELIPVTALRRASDD